MADLTKTGATRVSDKAAERDNQIARLRNAARINWPAARYRTETMHIAGYTGPAVSHPQVPPPIGENITPIFPVEAP